MAGGAVQTVGPVVWDWAYFQRRHPTLAEWMNPDMGQMFFDIATLFLDNTDGGSPIMIPGFGVVGSRCTGSPVRDIAKRQLLLSLLVAHIATLHAPVGGAAPSGLVGRISSAGEGSVNVSVDYPQTPGAEWFTQTQWGAMFWQATAVYRLGRYYPPVVPLGGYSYSRFGRRF